MSGQHRRGGAGHDPEGDDGRLETGEEPDAFTVAGPPVRGDERAGKGAEQRIAPLRRSGEKAALGKIVAGDPRV